MMIGIGQKVDAVEGEPIDHLVACHDRILARLVTLEKIGPALETDPRSALAALTNVLRFFDQAGRLHTEDEEASVFPRLRQRLSPEDRAYLDSLEAQHREKEQVYGELKSVAVELAREITPARVAHYRDLSTRLCALYRPHIESENDVLVRLGREVLSQDERATIHEEMRARRR